MTATPPAPPRWPPKPGPATLAWPALLDASDAVVVATPAETHFSFASEALQAGLHVLVEKPIAATLDEADALATLAAGQRRVFQVGHLLRYSAEHQAISARMRRPLYIDCVRIAPFKPRGTDVSVILDLMIHDLDLVLSLVESELESVDAVGAPVASTPGGHRQCPGALRQRLRGRHHRQPDQPEDRA